MLPKAMELDRYLRRSFPELVRALQEEGRYEEHLHQSAETWSRIYGECLEEGLSHIQAVELAQDAVFPQEVYDDDDGEDEDV